MNRVTLTVLAVSALAGTAQAGFVYTFQQRSITATASADFGAVVVTDSLAAPDFGPFNANLEVVAVSTSGQHSGTGRAYQVSTLEPLRVFTDGGWSGLRSGGPGGLGGGTSIFNVNFVLDASSPFTFRAGLVSDLFMFSGPNGFLIDLPGDYAGTLQPGEYAISVTSSGSAGFPPSGSGFFMDLNLVPTPSVAAAFAPMALLAVRRRRA